VLLGRLPLGEPFDSRLRGAPAGREFSCGHTGSGAETFWPANHRGAGKLGVGGEPLSGAQERGNADETCKHQEKGRRLGSCYGAHYVD